MLKVPEINSVYTYLGNLCILSWICYFNIKILPQQSVVKPKWLAPFPPRVNGQMNPHLFPRLQQHYWRFTTSPLKMYIFSQAFMKDRSVFFFKTKSHHSLSFNTWLCLLSSQWLDWWLEWSQKPSDDSL